MKLFTQRGEIQMLRTLGSEKIPENLRLSLLGKLDKTMFHLEPTRKALSRFQQIAKKKTRIMDWEDLVQDPGLSEDYREMFEETDVKPCSSKKQAIKLIARLDEHRKVRFTYSIGKMISKSLEEDSVDIDALLDTIGNEVNHAKRNYTEDQVIHNFGIRGNMQKVIKKVLYSPSERMYKTGFKDFDNHSGGLPTEGVMLIAATTSGGKSVTSTNLLSNINELNKVNTVRITLEMSIEQEANRIMAMVTGAPFWKIKQGKLTSREKKKIEQQMEAWEDLKIKQGTQFGLVSPTKSMTIDEVLAMVRPFNYKVICLDYVSLLEGVDDENQWRKLSEITAACKRFSTATGTLLILLCQLDDISSKLRYSKGMKEHCDVMWKWNYSDQEVRAEKILHILVDKNRDGEIMPFDLKEQFEVMRVTNMDGSSAGITTIDEEDEDEDTSKIKFTRRKKLTGGKHAIPKKPKRKRHDFALE
jgi:replicative DNA helicase